MKGALIPSSSVMMGLETSSWSNSHDAILNWYCYFENIPHVYEFLIMCIVTEKLYNLAHIVLLF